ncbi:hypothetical protein LGT39_05765 [Demequina sp. TTPB684]|uniref:hypothetical protein n=1 Tax=unclassified Demequina TaxID=2620311 RepID=UPI001CF4257A|nr:MULTISPECIES: hypothetical protein [unclassified Demequina]MCB2412354.1 hypothetical protein [Demequina sp. TTPB684]UPU89024.1 hypothetical protein LGT36_003620 [Demequina sp. TMPB413]
MVAFCKDVDVEARLERQLTTGEAEYIDGKIAEAQALVVGYMGCGETPYATVADVPATVTIVTSRIVARVIEQKADTTAGTFGADQISNNVGPFGRQVSFSQGSRTNAPWLTKADREALNPYACSSKAFAVDTVGSGVTHADTCAINLGAGYCDCGAEYAGFPIFGS